MEEQVAAPTELPLFPGFSLPHGLVLDLRRMNPWWTGHALPALPSTRRHLVGQMQRRLELRLAPALVVRGPRQVGKTTAQLQLVSDLLERGVPPLNIFRVQADALPAMAELQEPLLRMVDWYESAVLGGTLNDVARRGEPTYLFFDEVQNLASWAAQLKALVDHSTTQVVVAGSTALRLELGQDSLAGRISTIEAGVLSLTEVAAFRGLDLGSPWLPDGGLEPLGRAELWRDLRDHGRAIAAARDHAFHWFSERGGYPLAHQRTEAGWAHLADQLAETVIRRVIEHDLRSGDRGQRRDAPLLEEMFRLACRYAGQAPRPDALAREAKRALGANVGPQRARQYLRFLADALLVRLVKPFEIRLKRTRGSDRICLSDHALRASWLQEVVPLDPVELEKQPHLLAIAGWLAKSVVGATLSTIPHLDLAHLPGRPNEPEVDFVLTLGARRIPLAVRYQRRLDPLADTEGLRSFLENSLNNAPFGLLITQTDAESVADPRIVSLPLSTLLLLR
jgi:predicted AAA+ superfamily ATPase